MSPSEQESLRRKLTYLHGVLKKLEPYRALSKEDFFAKEENLPLIERYLQTAIESVIDCSRLLVMLKGWRRVREESDAWLILERYDIISKELVLRLTAAKGFRNILVHEYTEIDADIVYRHLCEDGSDLDEFVRSIERYLQAHEVQ